MDMNTIIRPDFIVVALFLNVLGAILKYRTPITNKLLPVVLFGVGFVICAIWGYGTSVYAGGARVMDTLLMCGIIHGTIVTAIACWGWDMLHGAYKVGLFGKKKVGETK